MMDLHGPPPDDVHHRFKFNFLNCPHTQEGKFYCRNTRLELWSHFATEKKLNRLPFEKKIKMGQKGHIKNLTRYIRHHSEDRVIVYYRQLDHLHPYLQFIYNPRP